MKRRAPETSLRQRLQRSTMGLLLAVVLVAVATMAVHAFWTGAREARSTEERSREAIQEKGSLLARNYATSLRPLVVDNAFSDVERLLTTAVESDRDVLYGAYVHSNGRVWALARKPGLDDNVTAAAELRGDFRLRTRSVGRLELIELKEPVLVDGEVLGAVVFGVSTERVELARAEALAAQRFTLAVSLLVLVSIMACVGGVALFLTRRLALELTRPIEELAHAVERLAAGNEDVQVAVTSADEVGVLGENFNHMTTELSLSRKTLQKTNVELARSLADARELTRLKSEFLASMSHELRTPLNSIINIPEGLLEDLEEIDGQWEYRGKPALTRKYLQSLHTSGSVLLGIVNQVLDFSKLEAGKMQLHARPVLPGDVLAGVVSTLEGLAKTRRINLAVKGSAEAITVDKVKLSQVLLNLGSNAIKFSHDGATVEFELVDSPDQLVLRVKDTGIGIATKDQHTIFESFRQVEGGATRRFGGTGLGLTISKQLVELHQGRIEVESAVGSGSTFTVFVPRDSKAQVRPSGPPVVVVVDDDPIAQETLKLSLRDLNVEIVSITDPRTAFDAIASRRPALVILDMMMPHLSGLSVLQAVRTAEWGARLPVLALSAWPDNRELVEAFLAQWMTKPYDAAALRAFVQRVVEVSPER